VTRTADEIRDWLVTRVAAITGLPPADVDPDAPLTRHGLDSVTLIALIGEFEGWLGYRFRENPLDLYPTITALAGFLAGPTGGPG
jgi:acyl carrier protein